MYKKIEILRYIVLCILGFFISSNLYSFILFPVFLPGYDNCYTCKDGEDADGKLKGETLAENADADDDRRYRLQGSHDGGWRAADEIDGNGHEEKRQYRWQ